MFLGMMCKFLTLFLVLICGMFFIPETFATEHSINFKPYQESMILLVDQPNQEAHLTISLMSKSNEDFMISDQLEEKIKNTKGLISISMTNKDECVIGVQNETCILISLSRTSIHSQEEYDSVQEGAREIGELFIDDLYNLFPGSFRIHQPEFHSVFLHSGGQFLAGGDYESTFTGGIVSAIYTLPMLSTEELVNKMSDTILKKEIRSGEGFLDVAKKISTFQEQVSFEIAPVGSEDFQDVVVDLPRSTFTFSILPEQTRVLYMFTTLLDIPIEQIDVYDLKPLDLIGVDTVSRSEYFSNGFFPLNSIISVVIYPENNFEVKKVNSPLITDLADVDILKQGGWFTNSFRVNATSIDEQSNLRDNLDMKYLFGTESSVSKQQLEIRSVPLGEELPLDEALPPQVGGCLIATAAFGSEMAPQVQFLREIRDNTVLQTESGSAFMAGFNQFYYSFSPVIADYERENPVFKEAVKLTLTPLLTSLTLLQYADIDSEPEMLGYGIGIILLNIGMYFAVPVVLIMRVRKNFCN